uniref:Thioredoxin domain-containing protein n=1 Tax=Mesocestoides corti TaxID=53468 RepID=A0A5K3FU67_MESCO
MRLWSLLVIALIFNPAPLQASVFNLTSANFKEFLDKHDTALVNFYAEWCRFSRDLAPVFNATGNRVAMEFKDGNVALGRVDCDDQGELCMENSISKYPTLRLFKFGHRYRSEYRNQRSEEALMNYLREQSSNPIKVLKNQESFADVTTERNILGVFPKLDRSDPVYFNFYKLSHLVTDCTFYAVEEKQTPSSIKFSLKKKGSQAVEAEAEPTADFDALRAWATDHCTPLVRELTFANAEEITEPRLPLLILFFHPDDQNIVDRFTQFMELNFVDLKGRFMLLVANGDVFSHPLLHMGKTRHDLPILAIDSFQHMFMFAGDIEEALRDPSHIRGFVADLHSGKLHRRFHGQPEPDEDDAADRRKEHAPAVQASSVFKLLTPSNNRYSLLKDEL